MHHAPSLTFEPLVWPDSWTNWTPGPQPKAKFDIGGVEKCALLGSSAPRLLASRHLLLAS